MDIYEEGYDYHGSWDEDAMQDIAMNERERPFGKKTS